MPWVGNWAVVNARMPMLMQDCLLAIMVCVTSLTSGQNWIMLQRVLKYSNEWIEKTEKQEIYNRIQTKRERKRRVRERGREREGEREREREGEGERQRERGDRERMLLRCHQSDQLHPHRPGGGNINKTEKFRKIKSSVHSTMLYRIWRWDLLDL